MKHKIVEFKNGLARIITTDDVSKFVEDKKTIFINPMLAHLRGVPPELWEVKDGLIVEIKDEDRKQLRLLALRATTNTKDSHSVKTQFLKLLDDVEALNENFLCHIIQNTKDSVKLEDQIKSLKLHQKLLYLAITISFLALFLTHT